MLTERPLNVTLAQTPARPLRRGTPACRCRSRCLCCRPGSPPDGAAVLDDAAGAGVKLSAVNGARDTECPGGAQSFASPTCSSIAAAPGAFAAALGAYAFPYDDVTPNGGINQAGAVSSGSPEVLTVTLSSVH
jgi:hypothetical protein